MTIFAEPVNMARAYRLILSMLIGQSAGSESERESADAAAEVVYQELLDGCGCSMREVFEALALLAAEVFIADGEMADAIPVVESELAEFLDCAAAIKGRK